MSVLPSGCQYTIVNGGARAVAVEVGGGIRSYVVDGREVLDGYAENERATAARGQPLVPWPNRLADGRYTWDGEAHQTPLTEPAKNNAIHGYVRFANWTCLDLATNRVELGYVLHPQPGYPFTLTVRLSYVLDDDGALTVSTRATNVGDTALPYASGQHPYLAAPTGLLDDCALLVPASHYLPTDGRGLPTGVREVEGTPYDFRQARALGDLPIDYAFTGLARDDDGRAWVRLQDRDGRGTELWVDEGYPYVELFTGDTLPDGARRRRGLGVEPMTSPPNGLQSGTDVLRLEPGEFVTTSWGLRVLG
jgi:aldose 1-epimerase